MWRDITKAFKTQRLTINELDNVLLQAFHSIHTLLSTATNVTPHERLINYTRRSSCGSSTAGKVPLKRHVKQSNFDPIVVEAERIESNLCYGNIRLQNDK